MLSCPCHARAASRVFSRLASYYRYRYRLLGLERTQRQLVAGLAGIGFQNATLLEVGCGVGYLHQWLLCQGASRAVGVDLSEPLLVEAQTLADWQGVDHQVSYLQGDFTELTDHLPLADIVIMDKVVCCYPDARTLLNDAAAHAVRGIALTYPRNHFLSRTVMRLLNQLLDRLGSGFQTYLHDPLRIEEWLGEAGWIKHYQRQTLMWLTQVYVPRAEIPPVRIPVYQ